MKLERTSLSLAPECERTRGSFAEKRNTFCVPLISLHLCTIPLLLLLFLSLLWPSRKHFCTDATIFPLQHFHVVPPSTNEKCTNATKKSSNLNNNMNMWQSNTTCLCWSNANGGRGRRFLGKVAR